MTELQQARSDYIAALERENKLSQKNAELQRELYELKQAMIVSAFQRYANAMSRMLELA